MIETLAPTVDTSAGRMRVPQHVAVIMDGNRRWARQKGLLPVAGHLEGVQALLRTVRAARQLGVKVLTVFGFSTENWQRGEKEVGDLLSLMQAALKTYREQMIHEGVRFNTIGDMSRFPSELQKGFCELTQATAGGEAIDLVVAMNYGGRDDIRRGFLRVLDALDCGKISRTDLTERLIGQYLDTAAWPDPEILIRTSGEMRVSNFLLWTLCYSEIVISETLWPDFGHADLQQAVEEYQRRERRWGS